MKEPNRLIMAKMGSSHRRIGPMVLTVVSPTDVPVAKAAIRITPTYGRIRAKIRVLNAPCILCICFYLEADGL